MNTFRLTIATPDGAAFDGEADMLSVRGVMGDLAIMAGHVPFVTAVMAGKCAVDDIDGERRTATLDGGLLTVADNEATLLSGSFRWDD